MALAPPLRQIKIFISSPGDVKEEREAALEEIKRLEGLAHIRNWLSLKAYAYERETPAAVGKSAQRTVDEYMLEADEADIFVCILWKRMGSPLLDETTGERFNSGTEYEFKKAYAAYQKSGSPQILLYRSMKPLPPDIDTDQLKLVQEFFQRFHGETSEYKGLPTQFPGTDEFRKLLFRHLDDILSKHFLPPREPVTLPSSKRHDFYRHVTLPVHYIERKDLITEVRDIVLGCTSCCIGLHAMGGAGKSVLARALCDVEGIQAAFSDGILWASLGKTPDVMARMREWIGELGGTITENAPTQTSLKNNLAELLKDKACLLIVDDVWDYNHADSFRVDAVNCRLLMTTRDAETVRPLGAEIHLIPMLTQPEAIELLDAWGGDSVKRLESGRKEQVIARLGRHPLAIKLAGAQLQQKPIDDWFRDFEIGKLKLKRPDPADPHTSIMATFNLSLEDLSERDSQLYKVLAIFKEDEVIPESAIIPLWKGLENLGHLDVSDLLEDLASRALLELITRDGARFARIHGLLRGYSEKELGSEGVRKANEALLSSYRGPDNSVGWHTVPNDGYLYSHLSYHFKEIGDYEELRKLFTDQNWMNARVPTDKWLYDGYLADLSIAWEMADCKVADDEEYLVDSFRYGLIWTSINSLAANYVPELVVTAVENGIWSPERALSVAEKMPLKKQEHKLIKLLLETDKLTETQRSIAYNKVLDEALTIRGEDSSLQTQADVFGQVNNRERMEALSKTLNVTTARMNKLSQVQTLCTKAAKLSGKKKVATLWQAYNVARSIRNKLSRVQALCSVAAQQSGEEKSAKLRLAYNVARDIKNNWWRTQALVAVAGQLSGEKKAVVLRQAHDAARTIGDKETQVQALIAVAGQLEDEEKAAALREARNVAQAAENGKSQALVAIIGQLSGEEKVATLQNALDTALAIRDEWRWARVLATVAGQLGGEEKAAMLQNALDTALAIGDEWRRSLVLAAIAKQLNKEENATVLRHVRDAALAINDENSRAQALVAVAAQLSGVEKTTVLQNALDAARAIGDECRQSQVLAAIAGKLSGDENIAVLRRVLGASLNIKDKRFQVRAMATVAEQQRGKEKTETLRKALDAAHSIVEERWQAEALSAVAAQLRGEEKTEALRQALDDAHDVDEERGKAEALSAVAEQLSGEENATMLRKVLDAVLAIGDEEWCVYALSAVVTHLAGEKNATALQKASHAACSIKDKRFQVQALAVVAEHLRSDEKTAAVRKALDSAYGIENEECRAKVLIKLLRHLDKTTRLLHVKNCLYWHKDSERAKFLEYCCTALFPTLNLQPATFKRIAESIIDICSTWKWL